MTNLIAKTAAVALVAAATFGTGLMTTTTPADASEHCKGVHITVNNPSGATIKVIDIDYYDASSRRWKSEPVKNRTLRAGQTWTWKKRLENVAAERTKVRVEYRVFLGKTFNKWSKKKSVTLGPRTCTRNMTWRFSI